jgi:hypothetical protein
MGLPIGNTLQVTTLNLRARRTKLIRALALPSFLIAVVSIVVWFLISSREIELMRYVAAVSFLQIPLWGLLAVSCHRVLLDDPDQPTIGDGVWLGVRQLHYLLLALIVGIPLAIHGAALPTLVFSRFDPSNSNIAFEYLKQAYIFGLLVPLQYVSSRFALALPAAALREPMSLLQAWSESRRNGWRLTAVLLAAPFVYRMLLPLIDEEAFSHLTVYGVFITVVQIAMGIFSIAALSYSYQWFMNDGLGIDAN